MIAAAETIPRAPGESAITTVEAAMIVLRVPEATRTAAGAAREIEEPI
jgi:hypothetical protein